MVNTDSPLQLLVVEDSPTDRSWLVMMLNSSDAGPFEVEYAETMASAESALHNRDYDCVLLDLSLPDCDGVESVRRAVLAGPETAVVVFTGRDEQELGLRSIEAGAEDYLVKGQVNGNRILTAARWAVTRLHQRGAVAGEDPAVGWAVPTVDLVAEVRAPAAQLDARLTVGAANEGFAALVGLPIADLVGSPLTALVTPAEVMAVADGFRPLVQGDVAAANAELSFLARGGRERSRWVTGVALSGGGALVVVLDGAEADQT